MKTLIAAAVIVSSLLFDTLVLSRPLAPKSAQPCFPIAAAVSALARGGR
ncbi:MAG: hypothetical protein JNK82_33590 [Myxococcaceae bacterium]|nr:hypothetical protein [Myxococcaceae bacterium]